MVPVLGKWQVGLLLVPVLHNPGLLGNKLRGRNAQLHEPSKCGRKAANKPVCQLPKNVDTRAKTYSLKNTSWFFAYSRAYFLNALSLTTV